jgi:hypothetical protein
MSRSVIALCAALVALPAAALQMRPDRDEAEYLELASRYPAAIVIGNARSEAVLVAPRWALTSARNAAALAAAKQVASHHVRGDLGLVQLKEPLKGVAPMPPYRGGDEDGKTVALAAHGRDGRPRAAINTVEAVEPERFRLRVKALDEASDLQGAITAAQLGSGAYVQVDGVLFVAGIAVGVSGGAVPGNVGDWASYARVSAFTGWIDAVLLDAARAEANALLDEGGR